jgi:hypothetical protein
VTIQAGFNSANLSDIYTLANAVNSLDNVTATVAVPVVDVLKGINVLCIVAVTPSGVSGQTSCIEVSVLAVCVGSLNKVEVVQFGTQIRKLVPLCGGHILDLLPTGLVHVSW